LGLERFYRLPLDTGLGTAVATWTGGIPVTGPPDGVSTSVPSTLPIQVNGAAGIQLFPDAELRRPFTARGPSVDLQALQALVMAHDRGRRLRRRSTPYLDDLIEAGLTDIRGAATGTGKTVAEMIAMATHRIWVQASVDGQVLTFRAYLLGGRALVLADGSPQDSGTDAAAGTRSRASLDLQRRDQLPVTIAQWIRLPLDADPPAEHEHRMSWQEVQRKFREPAAKEKAGEPGPIGEQAWSGWAMGVDESSPRITVVQAGGHTYSLIRPDAESAILSWVRTESLWGSLLLALQDVVPVAGPEQDGPASPRPGVA
jgi:hypothetical protein